jgi:dephospho-CoA kinase
MNNFYLIGLTGNLASGKSTVRRMLEQLGAAGIDADRLAHAAMRRGSPAWGAIVDTFGTGILHYNGNIDRQKLGARVFADGGALQQLESILHPAVGELIKATLREIKADVAVIEAVKLVEAGMDQWCDALWVVISASEVQVARVSRDRQMRPEDARARLAAQGSQDEKLKRANVVIDNSHDLDTTWLQVQNAWNNTVRIDKARDKSPWLARTTAPVQPAPSPEPLPPAPYVPPPSPETHVDVVPAPLAPAEAPKAAAPVVELEAAPLQATPISENAGTAAVEPSPVMQKVVPLESKPLPEIAPGTTIEVRRARRKDLDLLAVALARGVNQTEPLARGEVMQRFGKRGYRIAIGQGRIIALAAWEAENLVAMMRDIWAESEAVAPRALPSLFALVEQDAQALQCEVSLIIIPPGAPTFVLEQIRACDYQNKEATAIHRLWRQVVEERMQPGDVLWVKRLREDMVTKPI